jgi:TatD DNase family protein
MKVRLDQVGGFDFHCHVDLHPDPAWLISQCEAERIVTVAVTTTPRAWAQNRKWTARSGYVHAAVGLHPELVGERFDELDLLADCMNETRLIGEVGLDGSPQHRKHFSRQREVFGRVLKTAQALGGRVLTIHSRRAPGEVIDMIKNHTSPDRVLTILHWFSGTAAAASRAAACGCYFSVNSAMLDSERGQALVRKLPPERLLTETDSPFTRTGNRNSAPWDVNLAVERMAILFGTNSEDIRAALKQNATRVLSFVDLAGNDGKPDQIK